MLFISRKKKKERKKRKQIIVNCYLWLIGFFLLARRPVLPRQVTWHISGGYARPPDVGEQVIYVGHWLWVHCAFLLHCCLRLINKELFTISSKGPSLKFKHSAKGTYWVEHMGVIFFTLFLHVINYNGTIILVFSLARTPRNYRPASRARSRQEHKKQEDHTAVASGSHVPNDKRINADGQYLQEVLRHLLLWKTSHAKI